MAKHITIRADALPRESGSSYPAPFRARMGDGHWHALGDAFGITQFGVNLETLEPGAQSALRHWHTRADELVYVVEGELCLRTDDGEFTLTPGMCAGFPAGVANGHHLVNRSLNSARFVVIGARIAGDVPVYPDDDLAAAVTPAGRQWVHKDGSPYPDE